jgi:xanthine dehydrogenase YagR molybdenum-binding subunit
MYALESAMDELAVALRMDPVELRRRDDTDRSPINGARYTSRSLMECYDQAAAKFGWSRRNPEPGSMRDGDWLIGWGRTTATYPTRWPRQPRASGSTARAQRLCRWRRTTWARVPTP